MKVRRTRPSFDVSVNAVPPAASAAVRGQRDAVVFVLCSDVPTSRLATVTHTITLTNSAVNWLVLGNITLDPYASMLGAYQIGNTNFAALWMWHRTNAGRQYGSESTDGGVSWRQSPAPVPLAVRNLRT